MDVQSFRIAMNERPGGGEQNEVDQDEVCVE